MVGSSVFPARDNCSTVMGVMDARSSASDVRSVAVRTAMPTYSSTLEATNCGRPTRVNL